MDRFDYSQIPDHLMAALKRYIERGTHPGDFLEAVINNDLQDAVGRADDTNLWLLPVYVCYLYNHAPVGCWGHSTACIDWQDYIHDKMQDAAREAG